MIYGGDGLARHEGQVVMAPFVLPGETVTVKLDPPHKGLRRGRVQRVDAPAAQRQAAPCPLFARCGGCHYQHAPYELQLAWKREILREVLRRVGKIEAPDDIPALAGEPWGYRNRVQIHAAAGRLGFLEPGSRTLCPARACPIASPRLNQALADLAEMARSPRWPAFLRSLELFTNESQVQLNVLETSRPLARHFFDWCARSLPGASEPLEYPTRDFRFRVGGRSFFQVNRFLLDALVDAALADARGNHALDLYAGVGLFSLPLARRFARVTAVETTRAAAQDLAFNAARAGLPVDVRQASVEIFLAEFRETPDFILADPPRSGLGKHTVRRLVELKTPLLVIVACDPATLARDLAVLAASGYRIDSLILVDLFPQTYHLESIARLRWTGA
jgi:23S rRNA (uracil1939-C5)-methyltransferase